MNPLIQQVANLVKTADDPEDIIFAREQVVKLHTPEGYDLMNWRDLSSVVDARALEFEMSILMKADGITPPFDNIPDSETELHALWVALHELNVVLFDFAH